MFFQALLKLAELELMALLITVIGIGERPHARHTLHTLLQHARPHGYIMIWDFLRKKMHCNL